MKNSDESDETRSEYYDSSIISSSKIRKFGESKQLNEIKGVKRQIYHFHEIIKADHHEPNFISRL